MRALMVACTSPGLGREMGVAGRGPGALVAQQFLDDSQRHPACQPMGRLECRSVWMEASLGRPLWRTRALKVFWREVGDRGLPVPGRGNQGRGRWRRQYSRNTPAPAGQWHEAVFAPFALVPRTRIRCASMSETCSWVPSVRRSPQA